MSDLQLGFLLEAIINVVVILAISSLAFGKLRLWVVGHASFLASGGAYAWFSQFLEPAMAVGAATLVLLCCAVLLSITAAWLKGDRFVVVSLAGMYATSVVFFGLFGEGVRNLPGATSTETRSIIVAFSFVICTSFALYLRGLSRSNLGAVILVARDHPLSLASSGYSVRPLLFWGHFISVLPIGAVGILLSLYYGTYSPNSHSASRCLVTFAVALAFGTNSIQGAIVGGLLLSSLKRMIDYLFTSAAMEQLMQWYTGTESVINISNLSVAVTEATLALALIIVVRLRPQGLLGEDSRWIGK